jgi:hypothetical protein
MAHFAGLEDFNTMLEDDATSAGVFSDSMGEMIELIADTEEVNAEMAEFNDFMTKSESAFAFVSGTEALCKSIEDYGISRGQMMSADPTGMWLSKMGLTSYEELPVTPIKDQVAVAAVEGMKDTLKKWGTAVKNFFKKIWEFIKRIFGKVIQMFQKVEKVLKQIKEKLEKITLDDEKMKDKKIKTLPATDMKKWADIVKTLGEKLLVNNPDKLVTKVAKSGDVTSKIIFEVIKKELFDSKKDHMLAVGYKENDKKEDFASTKDTFTEGEKEASLKDHKYDTSKGIELCDLAIAIAAMVAKFPALQKSWEQLLKASEKELDSIIASGEENKKLKTDIENKKKIISQLSSVQNAIISAMKKVCSNTIQIGNALIACEKK